MQKTIIRERDKEREEEEEEEEDFSQRRHAMHEIAVFICVCIHTCILIRTVRRFYMLLNYYCVKVTPFSLLKVDKKHFFGSEQRTRARAHAHTHAHIVDSTGNISVGRFTLFSVRVRVRARVRFLLPRLFLHLTPQRFFHLLHRRSSILPEKALLPYGVHHA